MEIMESFNRLIKDVHNGGVSERRVAAFRNRIRRLTTELQTWASKYDQALQRINEMGTEGYESDRRQANVQAAISTASEWKKKAMAAEAEAQFATDAYKRIRAELNAAIGHRRESMNTDGALLVLAGVVLELAKRELGGPGPEGLTPERVVADGLARIGYTAENAAGAVEAVVKAIREASVR